MNKDAPVAPDTHEAATHVGHDDNANRAGERWNWRWRSWTRWPLSLPIVALTIVTVVVDIGTAWANVSLGTLGRVPVTPALPLGILLALLVGLRRLGLDPANRWAWREFLAVSSVRSCTRCGATWCTSAERPSRSASCSRRWAKSSCTGWPC